MRRTIWILAGTAAVLAIGAALAGTSSETGSADPATATATTSATTATEAPATTPTSVTLTLSKAEVVWGERVVATGTVAPVPEGGETVVLERDSGAGMWVPLGQASVDAYGAYTIELDPRVAGTVRARTLSGGTSPQVRLDVAPAVRVKTGAARAFRHGTLRLRVAPASYDGRVTAVVRRDGRRLAKATATVRNGRATLRVATPAVGPLWVELRLPAEAGLSARTLGAKLVAKARPLALGASGPEVVALRDRLAELRFYVPARSRTFSEELYDSVIAFQKAYGLERSGTVDALTWRKLATAAPLRPRYRRPARHIEVDKTRQILLVVERGQVVRVLPVSTGATGNTPEGHHAVRWKAPATTTWLGEGILYRTLTFVGNAFAIHGWYSVPAYPASHGCVRIPIWMADWLYNRTPVGEAIIVHR